MERFTSISDSADWTDDARGDDARGGVGPAGFAYAGNGANSLDPRATRLSLKSLFGIDSEVLGDETAATAGRSWGAELLDAPFGLRSASESGASFSASKPGLTGGGVIRPGIRGVPLIRGTGWAVFSCSERDSAGASPV